LPELFLCFFFFFGLGFLFKVVSSLHIFCF
jgi:hypothetical protein